MASKKLPSKSEPQTMEELLAETSYQIQGLRRGQTVSGKVTAITPKAVFLDIGAKTEGVVMERGFEVARSFIKTLKVGDEVLAQVVSPELESGQILLSLRKAASSAGWQKLQTAKEKEEEMEVEVKQVTRAGLLVEAEGLPGFIPLSQISSSWQGKTYQLVGQKLKVKIREIDDEERKLIFSEKAVSEKDRLVKMEKILAKVTLGEVYEGVVRGIASFGVFVQVKIKKIPLEGLVHISEVSWEKVEDLSELLKVNQKVKVKVIGVDKKEGRLALSLKQLSPDPWQKLILKYPVDTKISGKVTRVTNFGVFVQIQPGLEGFLPIAKLPARKKIEKGEGISCFVEEVDGEKRRLFLGLVLQEKPVGYK